jgi:hypothetical protein
MGRRAISNKWVFKEKLDELGNIIRFKARLVARGFSQVFGVDYLDTFAPIAKLAALRILLVIATMKNLEVHQMDVVTAFLIPDLEEEIYSAYKKVSGLIEICQFHHANNYPRSLTKPQRHEKATRASGISLEHSY